MRRLLFLSSLFLGPDFVRACEVCLSNQPKYLQGWTHGAGPQGDFDYLIVFVAMVIVLVTLGFAIKFLVQPGEREPDHIKRTVLNQSYEGVQRNR